MHLVTVSMESSKKILLNVTKLIFGKIVPKNKLADFGLYPFDASTGAIFVIKMDKNIVEKYHTI